MAVVPSRAVFPALGFHILFLYKKCVSIGVMPIPIRNVSVAGINMRSTSVVMVIMLRGRFL